MEGKIHFTNLSEADGLVSRRIESMAVSSEAGLFFGTDNGLVLFTK